MIECLLEQFACTFMVLKVCLEDGLLTGQTVAEDLGNWSVDMARWTFNVFLTAQFDSLGDSIHISTFKSCATEIFGLFLVSFRPQREIKTGVVFLIAVSIERSQIDVSLEHNFVLQLRSRAPLFDAGSLSQVTSVGTVDLFLGILQLSERILYFVHIVDIVDILINLVIVQESYIFFIFCPQHQTVHLAIFFFK